MLSPAERAAVIEMAEVIADNFCGQERVLSPEARNVLDEETWNRHQEVILEGLNTYLANIPVAIRPVDVKLFRNHGGLPYAHLALSGCDGTPTSRELTKNMVLIQLCRHFGMVFNATPAKPT